MSMSFYEYLRRLNEEDERAPKQQATEEGYHPEAERGSHFAQFFSDVSRGRFGRSGKGFEYASDMEFGDHHYRFAKEAEDHLGYFDDHIAKSIPTFREIQFKKGHALVATFGHKPAFMLDIGGSEGSFAKAVTALSGGNIRTMVLDPNEDMADHFRSKSQVEGSHYVQKAFYEGWIEDDGSVVDAMHAGNTTHRFDIIHESMAFQFINNLRHIHFREVKKLLKPNGLFITEEKVRTHPDVWKANENFKDQHHKSRYFTEEDLRKKQKVVGFAQDDKDRKASGMVDNMVSHDQLERLLSQNFKTVIQYWDSGNFKGYAASDNAALARKFVSAMGDNNNKFATTQLPRKVPPPNPRSFGEWLMETHDVDSIVAIVIPVRDELSGQSFDDIKSQYLDLIRDRLVQHELECDDERLERAIRRHTGRPGRRPFCMQDVHDLM